MSGCHCHATDRYFTPTRARAELATYRRRGPTGTARLILQSISETGLTAETLLDIGAGVGVLHHELLDRGVRTAVHLEAASAYMQVAKEESSRRGHDGRVTFQHGDLVALDFAVPAADLVTLDRVVCCYPDLESLIRISAARARKHYVLSFPPERWYVKLDTWWQNEWRRRAGNPFRTFVHPVSRLRQLLVEAGLHIVRIRRSVTWIVFVCTREPDLAGGAAS
jgi:magnesium-protoporphyrin O-methyltransferase